MRKLLLLIAVLMLLVAGIVSAQEQTYIVKPGDTITGIARAFNVDAQVILIRNNLINPNTIRSGQTLIIPTGALTVPVTHVVQPGENLTDIATRYNTTVAALIATNQLGNANQIVRGQVLTLPATGGPATFPRTYRIDVGDTLRNIGEKFGVTWQQIAAFNNIANPNLIYAGMVIQIPPIGYVPPATPPSGPVVTPPQQPITYVVQQGDTLSSISRRFNVTVTALAQYNNITNNRLIFAGDVLVIPPTGGPVTTPPVSTSRQTVNGYYYVQAGDTLFAISRSFGVNIYTIAQANSLLNLNAIYAGQPLRIPGR
jgi:LysM repeat protein